MNQTIKNTLQLSLLICSQFIFFNNLYAATIWAVDGQGERKSGSTGDQIITFNSETPWAVTVIGETGISNTLMSGLDFDNKGDLYSYSNANHSDTNGLFSIDQKTGKATLIGNGGNIMPGEVIEDLSFSQKLKKMYAISNFQGNRNFLHTIDLQTGESTRLGEIRTPSSAFSIGLATNKDGQFFFHDLRNDQMYEIVEGPFRVSGLPLPSKIGYNSNFSQGMTFNDSRDNKWYHAATLAGNERINGNQHPFYTVNQDGSEEFVGSVGYRFDTPFGVLQSIAASGKKIRPGRVQQNPYEPGDIAIKPQRTASDLSLEELVSLGLVIIVDEEGNQISEVVLTSPASGKKAIRPNTTRNIATINFSPNESIKGAECITLLDIIFTGVDTSLFSVPDFAPETKVCANDILSLDIVFTAPGDPGFLGLHLANIGLMTDIGANSGEVGEILTFGMAVEVVSEPGTLFLLLICSGMFFVRVFALGDAAGDATRYG